MLTCRSVQALVFKPLESPVTLDAFRFRVYIYFCLFSALCFSHLTPDIIGKLLIWVLFKSDWEPIVLIFSILDGLWSAIFLRYFPLFGGFFLELLFIIFLFSFSSFSNLLVSGSRWRRPWQRRTSRRSLLPLSRGVQPLQLQLLLQSAGLFRPTGQLFATIASNPATSPQSAPRVQLQLRPRLPSLLLRSNERVFSPPSFFPFLFLLVTFCSWCYFLIITFFFLFPL